MVKLLVCFILYVCTLCVCAGLLLVLESKQKTSNLMELN